MSEKQVLKKLLRFDGLRIDGWHFQGNRDWILLVKPHKNGCRCPYCGRRCQIHRVLPQARRWRDIPVCGWRVWLQHWPREISCPTHGRVVEDTPWAAKFSRVTYRLEFAMLRYCQTMTQRSAAELLHMPKSTLSENLHRTIERLRDGHRIRGLRAIGVDEVSYSKGHKYATIVYDLKRSCVVWVGKGKKRETIDRFFEEELSPYQKSRITWVCCDMSETYIGALKAHCPNARLVIDRFHVCKALNEALDEVRKEQWRKATKEQRKALKGLRWLLFRHSSNRSSADRETLRALEQGNRRIYRAWRLKDEFERFWDYKAPWAAKKFLARWSTAALRSRLEPLRSFVNTLRSHYEGILAFIDSRLTNAQAEGLNRIIKIIKNRASGFRNLEAFTDLIFLTVGDRDLPAQIPARFHVT